MEGSITVNFIRLMSNLRPVIENAYLIDKNTEEQYIEKNPGHKFNDNIKFSYVLVSAFEDGASIVPVKLTILEYLDDTVPKLHVAMTTTEIEKSRIITVHQNESDEIATSTSTIKLADLLSNVNDKALSKYIPEQFFNNSLDTDQKQSINDDIAKR